MLNILTLLRFSPLYLESYSCQKFKCVAPNCTRLNIYIYRFLRHIFAIVMYIFCPPFALVCSDQYTNHLYVEQNKHTKQLYSVSQYQCHTQRRVQTQKVIKSLSDNVCEVLTLRAPRPYIHVRRTSYT